MKNNNESEKIDFVITWVDGNDKEWQKDKDKYSPNKNTDARNIRYRDWGFLKYWFRGVEEFAPWVNKIHFVTWGHVPEWLDTTNPKLNIVKHSDYMPEEYLPTFSSHPIELNLHRIEDLSERFVYFNDDMFIINKVKPEHFFKNGKPCGTAVFNPAAGEDEVFIQILNNNNLLLNRNFNRNQIIKKNLFRYLNLKYGKLNIKTLLCIPWRRIQGFYDTHSPNAFCKSTFNNVWKKEYQVLDATSKSKFRSVGDVNQYVFKYWQFCEGDFKPQKMFSKYCNIQDNIDVACNLIESKKYKTICLNDNDAADKFEEAKERIINSFEKKLPQKSSFEI